MEVHVRLFIQAWRTPLIQALHSSTLVSKNTKKPTRLFLITQKRIQKGVFFALVTMTHARTRPHTDTHIFFGGRGEKQIVFSVVEQICLPIATGMDAVSSTQEMVSCLHCKSTGFISCLYGNLKVNHFWT